jgi:transcriptional regulator with GAF, ATPase, and Fis domain
MYTETQFLLNLSYDINSIRNKRDLSRVINDKLPKLFHFKNIVIFVLSQDCPENSFMFSSGEPTTISHLLESAANMNCQMQNCWDRIVASDSALLFDMADISSQAYVPGYLRHEFDQGILEKMTITFRVGEHSIGVFCVNATEKDSFTDQVIQLIKCVAYQLSISILNIIANEEIQHREQEKTRILAFSNTIASVRDKNVLAKLLKKQLKELFNITDYVIHALSDDKTKHSPILFDPAAKFAGHPDFLKLINSPADVNDGVFDKILASEDPVFFNVAEWDDLPSRPVYIEAARAEGLQQMVGVSICIGQERIGVMNFQHDDYRMIVRQKTLFKSIISQIAITVCNIIANEKIRNQLTQINAYKQRLEEEKIYLKEEIDISHNYAEIIGDSPVMQKVFRLISQVSSSDSTVLILGETGTGKELVARAIHNNSPRHNKLMVKVNCAALPANLIESELFGHERGSFTGATERRLGKFELANGGTLFLDEIGEMPPELQVKLLRALQEREIERVGGKGTISVDVRIIVATNRDLQAEMAAGRFRSDLYYRLNIFPIDLPALRERREDIPALATAFLDRFTKKAGKRIKTIGNQAMRDMMKYNWPGNIRELEHLIERSILLTEGDTLNDIPFSLQKADPQEAVMHEETLIIPMDDRERLHIIQVLKYCKGKVGGPLGAADLLQIPASTLFSKMKKHGICKSEFS